MKRNLLALMALVLALGLAWRFARREQDPVAASSQSRESVSPEPKSQLPSLAAPRADAEPKRELAPATPIATPAEAVGATGTDEPQLTLVFGRVLPPVGEQGFAETPSCALVEATGARRRIECVSDGAFAIPGMAPGRYWLSASVDASAEGFAEFELAPGTEQREVNVQLERPWTVEVLVKSSSGASAPKFPLLVVAALEPFGDWFDEPTGSPSNPYGVGSFWPEGHGFGVPGSDVRGTLHIDLDSPVWIHLIHGHRVVARQRVSPRQPQVEFVIDPTDPAVRAPTLRGRLLDAETGEPLKNQRVSVTSQGSRPMRTDDDGRFEIRDALLSPGLCRITVQDPDHALDELVRLQPGVETDLGDLRVEGGLSIEGKVLGALGSGRERSVRFERLDESTGELVWNGLLMAVPIESEGSFRIGGLTPHRYQLTIEGGGGSVRQRRIVDLRSGSVTGLEFVLQHASTLSVVLDRPGRRLERVEFRDEAGTLLMAPKLWPGPPLPFKLAPGRYTLKLGDVERTVELGSEPLLVRLP